jgi:hypothetical protein
LCQHACFHVSFWMFNMYTIPWPKHIWFFLYQSVIDSNISTS